MCYVLCVYRSGTVTSLCLHRGRSTEATYVGHIPVMFRHVVTVTYK